MAKVEMPQGFASKATAGGERYYWQPSPKLRKAGWKGLSLGQDLSEAITLAKKRNAEIEAWSLGGARPTAAKRLTRQETIPGLIARYKKAGWPSVREPGKAISAGTQKEYGSKFRTLERWSKLAKDPPLAAVTPARVRALRDALMAPAKSGRREGEVRHTAAHATLRVARTLFTYAEQEGLIPRGSNPFENFGLATPDPRDHIWSPEAREAIVAEAEAAGEPSMQLAAELAFLIGQREMDLLQLVRTQWVAIPAYKMDADVYAALAATPVPAHGDRKAYVPQDVKGIRLRQNKGKRWIEVPVIGAMRAHLEAELARGAAANLATILFDDRTMRPWLHPNPEAGQNRFQDRFAALRAAAIARAEKAGNAMLAEELRTLQYRDFRRTAVVYLGELGLPDHLIAAITGHSLDETKKILETYMPRTTGMAARAIALSTSRSGTSRRDEQEKAG